MNWGYGARSWWRAALLTGCWGLGVGAEAIAQSTTDTIDLDPGVLEGAVAQVPDPNRDRLLPSPSLPETIPTDPETILPEDETLLEEPLLEDDTLAPETLEDVPPASETPEDTGPLIAVEQVQVVGSTVFEEADFAAIARPLEGRQVSLEELRQAADAITELYLREGYITSRAIVADQTVANGIVQIQVIEGSVEDIIIEGNRRVRADYIRDRIRLGTDQPLNKNRLEDQLRLLKTNPLFENVEASLRSGKQVGRSVLSVRVSEVNPFQATFSVDNYSPPSVGSERLGVSLRHRNLTGNGDELAAAYNRTTAGGANVFDFSYQIPLNAREGTLALRAAPNNNEIIDPEFAGFGIRGETELYEVSFRQPLVRSPREELALSLGFTLQNGQTFLFEDQPTPFGIGPDADGFSRTRVLKFGQDYVRRDVGGAWALRSQFNLGLDILDATLNDDPVPDGRFVSWLGQAQRVQVLNDNNLLIVQADLQLTPDTLLPSQQFVIGGGQSLRGFRQNARSGDNGFRVSVEDRIALVRNEAGSPIVQLAPFVDVGKVWNSSGNPNRLADQTFLAAAGLGLQWEALPGLTIRLDYAVPFIELSDRTQNAQDESFYFSVRYTP